MRIIVILIAIIILVVVFVRWQGGQYKTFLAQAEKIRAEIIAKNDVVIDQKNQRKEKQVQYRYTDAQGQVHNVIESLEYDDLWQSLEVGQQVDVYVSRQDSSKSYLAMAMDRRLNISNNTQ